MIAQVSRATTGAAIAEWQKVTLGEIYDIGSSKRVLQKQWKDTGVPFYRAREIVKLAKYGVVENDLFISEDHFAELERAKGVPMPGDLMVSAVGTLGACYVVQPGDRFYFKDASVLLFRPVVPIEARFMQYAFLSDDMRDKVNSGEGATVGTFTIARAKATELFLPPLDEQKRIVAILDKAFAALDRARALAEANLADARALFQSGLKAAFEGCGEGRNRVSFDRLCEAITPKVKIKRQDYLPCGTHPIVSQEANLISGYWNDATALMGLGEPVVIFGDHTCCLKYVDFDFVVGADGTKVLKPKTGVSAAYLYFGLRSQPIAEGGYARHFKLLREKSLPDIPIAEQTILADRLFGLEEKCDRLFRSYEAKLNDLANLRQSLLQTAFSGRL